MNNHTEGRRQESIKKEAALVSPLNDRWVSRMLRAQPCRVGSPTNTPEVKPIRIPTGLNGYRCFDESIAMQRHRIDKEIKTCIVDRDKSGSNCRRECGSSRPVVWVRAVVLPSTVVKKRE